MEVELAFPHDIEGKLRVGGIDRLIAELAERQHAVVARWQLLRMGIGRGAIEHRIGAGRLFRVHQGIYAVGHRVVSVRGRWMAAVLAAGPGAVLSHRSAAALWGLRPTTSAQADVTVPWTGHSRRVVQLHSADVPEDEVAAVNGIPVTTVPRTLLDLAAVLPARQVERALEEAEVRRLRDALSLQHLVECHSRRRGVNALNKILDAGRIGASVTRSELEERFLEFLDSAALPRPAVNVPIRVGGGWIEADFVFTGPRLIVELDGRASHGTAMAFERDRARDRALHVAGWRVVRVTWRQLHEEPAELGRDLRALIAPAAY